MRRSRLRLAVAAALFLGWLSWLVYLAATGTDDVVLSRSQFLVADVHLVATLKGGEAPEAEADVKEVFWPKEGQRPAPGETIAVANLPECADQGWEGPGDYLLALKRTAAGANVTYAVAPVPRTPGYPIGRQQPANRPGPPRIYWATPARVGQLKQIERRYGE